MKSFRFGSSPKESKSEKERPTLVGIGPSNERLQ